MTEALQKLEGGAKFDDVAREFSEDKARAGRFFFLVHVFRYHIFPSSGGFFWGEKADMRQCRWSFGLEGKGRFRCGV